MSDQPYEFEKRPGDYVKDGEDFTDVPAGPVPDRPLTSDETAAVITIVSRVVGGPIHADFTPNTLLFATIDPEAPSMPGSLYFSSGYRIRLVHPHGPQVSLRPIKLRQYWVTKEGERIFSGLKKQKINPVAIEQELLKEGVLTLIDPERPLRFPEDSNQRLLEFGDGEVGRDGSEVLRPFDHISRGTPFPKPSLNQNQINALVMAAGREQEEREVLQAGIRRLNREIRQLGGAEKRRKQQELDTRRTEMRQLVDGTNAVMRGCYNRFPPKT